MNDIPPAPYANPGPPILESDTDELLQGAPFEPAAVGHLRWYLEVLAEPTQDETTDDGSGRWAPGSEPDGATGSWRSQIRRLSNFHAPFQRVGTISAVSPVAAVVTIC